MNEKDYLKMIEDKKELEQNIKSVINEYELKTGLTVVSVNLRHSAVGMPIIVDEVKIDAMLGER